MFDLRKEYGTNEDWEVDGKWEDFGQGCRVKIARTGNKEYNKFFKKISAPYKKQIRRNTLSDEKALELMNMATGHCIIKDWEGLYMDGEPVAYSPEKAIELVAEIKDFRDAVLEVAGEMTFFQEIEDEESKKK